MIRCLIAAAAVATLASCTTGGAVEGHAVEFVSGREGGRCLHEGQGTMCRLTVVVRDDGIWQATGTQRPAPAEGTVEPGAATRLATVLDRGFADLTARPFRGTCPTAVDGQELWYAVRRIPTGKGAELADADVREVRGCTHDLDHPDARRVLDELDRLWRELGLPG